MSLTSPFGLSVSMSESHLDWAGTQRKDKSTQRRTREVSDCVTVIWRRPVETVGQERFDGHSRDTSEWGVDVVLGNVERVVVLEHRVRTEESDDRREAEREKVDEKKKVS